MTAARRTRRARLAPMALVLAGLVLLALPRVQDARGQWRQVEAAVEQDRELLAYRNAVLGAYDASVEDAVVSFETGPRPAALRTEKPPLPPVAQHAPSRPPVATATLFLPARIRIPSISVDQAVGEGIARADLRNGPGHYPGTAWPGQVGNSVISGHRTTYTRPFHDLDRLQPGDLVLFDTRDRTLTYRVERVVVVSTDDVSVLRAADYAKLTLTTCHPKGSARQRLVAEARLVTA